jgi:hypothetical protein
VLTCIPREGRLIKRAFGQWCNFEFTSSCLVRPFDHPKRLERSCFHRLSAACILPLMPFRESRRSTRVPLKVLITVEDGAEKNLDSRLLDGQACCGSGCLYRS